MLPMVICMVPRVPLAGAMATGSPSTSSNLRSVSSPGQSTNSATVIREGPDFCKAIIAVDQHWRGDQKSNGPALAGPFSRSPRGSGLVGHQGWGAADLVPDFDVVIGLAQEAEA